MKTINLLPSAPKRFVMLRRYQQKIVLLTSLFLGIFIFLILGLVVWEKLLVEKQEQILESENQQVLAALKSLATRQSLYGAISQKLTTVAKLSQERFPYEKILEDVFSLSTGQSRLTEIHIDKDQALTFSVQTNSVVEIQQLEKDILKSDFSPYFIYLLKDAIRGTDGTYTLSFLFNSKK